MHRSREAILFARFQRRNFVRSTLRIREDKVRKVTPISESMPSMARAANDATSRPRLARIAGALYLIVIAGGLFAGIIQDSLTVNGDAAATAAAIAAHESLWRWGIAVHLIYLAGPAIVTNLLLYIIFKPVHPILALLALGFGLVSVAIEAAALVPLYLPFVMAGSRTVLAAIGEAQRQELAYLAIGLSETGFGFALFFFSGFCGAIGAAIVRSPLVPKAIGVLMIAAGLCYFVSSLSSVVAPSLAHVLSFWIVLPCFLGEASLALWLLAKGTRSTRPASAVSYYSHGNQPT